MRVVWLLRARRELRDQRQYITRDQPSAAARIARAVRISVERLSAYPYYGRPAPWDRSNRIRELPVSRTPLVVVYDVDQASNTIIILRIVHGAQRRDPE